MEEKKHVKLKPACKNKKQIDYKRLMEQNKQVDGNKVKGRY